MDNNQIITTAEGLEELKTELQERMTTTRNKIADEIAKARDQGDLSENAAYTAALETKQFNETRILELESMIKNAVIKKVNTSDNYIGIGEKVSLIRQSDKKSFEYILVGETEAEPSDGKISIKSPIGSALIGKKEGDIVTIKLPSGKDSFQIKKVN